MIAPVHTLVTASIASIVVAVDDSGATPATLRAAGRLADATGGKLHVLYGVPTNSIPGERSLPSLQTLLSENLPAGVTPSSRTITTELERIVVDVAELEWADLIVLGPAGNRESSVEQITGSASCACLVVDGELTLPLRRVLVALDPSQEDCGALDEALRWCGLLGDPENGSQLIVLHVVPASELDEEFEHERLAEIIATAKGRARPPEWVNFARRVSCQDPVADAIRDAATREEAQLIVVGRNTRGALNRALLGSVATAVTRQSELPVLLVPAALCQT